MVFQKGHAVLQTHHQRCHTKISSLHASDLLVCKTPYRALLKMLPVVCWGLPPTESVFCTSKCLFQVRHAPPAKACRLLVEIPRHWCKGPMGDTAKSASRVCAVLTKVHAAASEMRPLDSVLTSLASLRVGRCTAVQLGRTCETSACAQSGSPSACKVSPSGTPSLHAPTSADTCQA